LFLLSYNPTNGIQDKYDLFVIPGGAKGADTISKDSAVQELVREYLEQHRFVGMICAGTYSYPYISI
jgi:protein DJ-1